MPPFDPVAASAHIALKTELALCLWGESHRTTDASRVPGTVNVTEADHAGTDGDVAFEQRSGPGSSLELRRLVREASEGEAVYGSGGFDSTGRRRHLRLPAGYTPAASDYVLFQWLDDDRFAVMAGAAHNEFGWNGFPGYGDILVCDITRERCTLATKGPNDDAYRIVPHLDVPN